MSKGYFDYIPLESCAPRQPRTVGGRPASALAPAGVRATDLPPPRSVALLALADRFSGSALQAAPAMSRDAKQQTFLLVLRAPSARLAAARANWLSYRPERLPLPPRTRGRGRGAEVPIDPQSSRSSRRDGTAARGPPRARQRSPTCPTPAARASLVNVACLSYRSRAAARPHVIGCGELSPRGRDPRPRLDTRPPSKRAQAPSRWTSLARLFAQSLLASSRREVGGIAVDGLSSASARRSRDTPPASTRPGSPPWSSPRGRAAGPVAAAAVGLGDPKSAKPSPTARPVPGPGGPHALDRPPPPGHARRFSRAIRRRSATSLPSRPRPW